MEKIAKAFKNSLLFLAALCCTALTAGAESTPLACWQFEGDYSDSCGGYLLAPSGTLAFSSDKATAADGATSLNIGDSGGHLSSTLVPPLNNFTIELFFRSAQADGRHVMMTTFDHTVCCDRAPHRLDGDGGWILSLWDGKVRFRQSHYGATRVDVELVSCDSFADNQWHHLLVSFSETNLMRMYVDGVFQGEIQDTRSTDPDRNPIRLGRSWYTCCDPFVAEAIYVGDIDQVRVYEGVVTPPAVPSAPCSGSNLPPVADAGEDQQGVPRRTLVTLDGSASSDSDGDYPLTFFWEFASRPEGSQAVLVNPDSDRPSFTVDLLGDYVASLTVTDAQGLSGASDKVVVSTANAVPLSDAGVDRVLTERGTMVQLDGTQSFDPEGDDLTFAWTMLQRPSTSTATLDDPSLPTPTFVADVRGDYVLQLVVTDVFGGASAPDTVLVSFNNVPPVADAGVTQTVLVGSTVLLDGSGSFDANLDPLTWQWSFKSKPFDSGAVLTNPFIIDPRFVADKPGLYEITLVVNDGTADSEPGEVVIVALTTQGLLQQTLDKVIDALNRLSDDALANKNHKGTLTGNGGIAGILRQIERGDFSAAYNKLEMDILPKLDGCAATTPPEPDKNDWITTCSGQDQVYPLIIEALEVLADL